LNAARIQFDPREICNDADGFYRPTLAGLDDVKYESQNDAGNGAGDRHQELSFWILGFCAHLRYAAKNEQCDPFHRDLVMLSYQGMTKLVEDNGTEEAQRASDPHPPIGAPREPRIGAGENGNCQRPGHQRGDHDPTGVQANLKTKELEESYASSKHVRYRSVTSSRAGTRNQLASAWPMCVFGMRLLLEQRGQRYRRASVPRQLSARETA